MSSIVNECRESCPTCQSIGSFNRLNYDNCAYDKRLQESVSPLTYKVSRYQFENCARCTYNGVQYAPFDLVDEESELKNIVRPATRCPSRKYDPSCQKSNMCTSTYDKEVPVVYPPNLCPVVCTNIKQMNNPGYTVEKRDYCDKPYQEFAASEEVNVPFNAMPFQQYPNTQQYVGRDGRSLKN